VFVRRTLPGGERLFFYLFTGEFFFTADKCGMLVTLVKDTVSKVEAMAALLPRVIDAMNLSADCYDWMSSYEMKALESKAPLL